MKYAYQTRDNQIVSLFPSDLNWEDFTDLPEEYGWYHSDRGDIVMGCKVREDGTLEEPEPPMPPTALDASMTTDAGWNKVVKYLDEESPLISAVLRLYAAKFEGKNDVAEQALADITRIVRSKESAKQS
jgi:hypothetical protein